MKSPGVLVLTVIICLASTGVANTEECILGHQEVTPTSPYATGGQYLDLQNRVQCSGSLVEWHFCYYSQDIDEQGTYVVYFQVLQERDQGTFTRVHSRTQSMDLAPQSGGSASLVCQTVTLEESDYFAIQAGDILGVYVLTTTIFGRPLHIIADGTTGFGLFYNTRGSSAFFSSTVGTDDLMEISSIGLHLYATIRVATTSVIQPSSSRAVSSSDTTTNMLLTSTSNLVPSQTATTGITGAVMPTAMLAISALPTSFAEVISSMALLSSSPHSTTQTETSSTSTPISSTPQPPASSRSRISSTLITAFGATTTVVSPTMQPVSSSAVPFSSRTRTTPRTAETSTSFGRLTTTTPIPAPTSAPFSSSTPFLSSDETSTSFGRLTTTTLIPAPTSAPFLSSTPFLSSDETSTSFGRLTTTTPIPAPTSAPFSSSTSFLSSDETSTSFGRLTTTTPIPVPTSAPFSSSTSFLSSDETLLTTSTITEEELPTTTSSETLPSITEESPTPSPSPIQNENETASADRFGSGAIAGIMVAIVVVIILVLLSAAFIIYKKRNIRVYFVKKRKKKQSGNYGIVNATYEEIQGTTVPHFSTARSEVKISPVYELSEFSNEFSIPDYEPIPFTNENAAEVYYSSMGPSPDYYHLLEQAKEGDVSYYDENPYYIPASQEDEIYKQLRQQGIKRIPQEELEVTMFLGSGQFGNVEKAIWKSRSGMLEVAVKTLAPGTSDVDKVKFLQEAAIMAQFKHPNVVSLHGVVSHGEMIMLVVELLQKGDLRQFLKSIRPDPGELVPPYTPRQLLGFSKQVALGMQYLSVKGFVHRDLAARNILVSDNNLCKIGDFGMSRDLADENYYISHGGQIPLKWTAPEALLYRKYSTASDVWSYGCLLYEIWSLGHKPFEGYKNQEVLLKLETGYRLPPPPGCPKVIYELMIQCWNPDTASRPGFRNLLLALLENEEAVLHIPAEALAAHKQAGSLGVPLEVGQEMYPDCQQAYYTEMTAL